MGKSAALTGLLAQNIEAARPTIELNDASIKSYQIRASMGDCFQAVNPQIPDLATAKIMELIGT